jgi:hypothetical protein
LVLQKIIGIFAMKRTMILVSALMIIMLPPLWAQYETDFIVDLASDYNSIVITGYVGIVAQVKIPATIQGIPVRAIAPASFAGNRIINSVEIPEGVTYIGSYAFANCKNLMYVTLPSSLTFIGESFFADSGLRSIVIPEGVTTIGRNAFSGCIRLSSVTLPSTIISIDYLAFNNCSSLTIIIIPDSISLIQFSIDTFSNCSQIPWATQAVLRRIGYMGRF